MCFYLHTISQKEAIESFQPPLLEKEGISGRKVAINKKEIIEPTKEDLIVAETNQHSTEVDRFAAKTELNAGIHYEVFSPKIDEQLEREIPIFLDDRNYMIPTQVTKDTEEAEVTIFLQNTMFDVTLTN